MDDKEVVEEAIGDKGVVEEAIGDTEVVEEAIIDDEVIEEAIVDEEVVAEAIGDAVTVDEGREAAIAALAEQLSEQHDDIQRMYPSISASLLSAATESSLAPEDDKNSLDIVTEHVTRPLAPVEEWRLPEALPVGELRPYYENALLDCQLHQAAEFSRQMRDGTHPLAELVAAFQRCARHLANAEQKLQAVRGDARTKEAHLWTVTERSEWREARCRDNASVRKTISWDDAAYGGEAARQLETALRRFGEDALDEHALLRYEAGLARALVDDCLVAVRSASNAMTGPSNSPGNDNERSLCLSVLFRCVRAPPELPEVTAALHQWIAFLGSDVATQGPPEQRLRLLWELLHAPAGVGRWGAGLLQPAGDAAVALAALALLLGPRNDRETFLRAWQPLPGTGNGTATVTEDDSGGWALVDSDGEDDSSVSASWALMRESDLLALLNQIPLATVFRDALGLSSSPASSASASESSEEQLVYEPATGCHPLQLLRVMAFSTRIVAILDNGLDNHAHARYKALNKRISRLIKLVILFAATMT